MAIQQSILSRIFPRVHSSPLHPQNLLEILRALDLELDFGHGVPIDGALKVANPKDLRSAFLRAQEALQRAKNGGAA